MPDGCPGCNISAKEKQEKYKSEYAKALVYAKEIQKLVIMWESDEGVPGYMEAEAAKLAGVRVTGYVPFV
jgi:hypothetical protein